MGLSRGRLQGSYAVAQLKSRKCTRRATTDECNSRGKAESWPKGGHLMLRLQAVFHFPRHKWGGVLGDLECSRLHPKLLILDFFPVSTLVPTWLPRAPTERACLYDETGCHSELQTDTILSRRSGKADSRVATEPCFHGTLNPRPLRR